MGVRRSAYWSSGRSCDVENNAPRLSIHQEYPSKNDKEAHKVARKPLFCWEDNDSHPYEAWGQLFIQDGKPRIAVLLTCPYWEAVPDEVAKDKLFNRVCGAKAPSLVDIKIKPSLVPNRTGPQKNLLDAIGEYYLLDVVARAQLSDTKVLNVKPEQVPGASGIKVYVYVSRNDTTVTGVSVVFSADEGRAFATARIADKSMMALFAKDGVFRDLAYTNLLRDYVIGEWWRRAVEPVFLDLDATRPQFAFNPLNADQDLPNLAARVATGQAAFGLAFGDSPDNDVGAVQWVWIASSDAIHTRRVVRLSSSQRLSNIERQRLFVVLSADVPRLEHDEDVEVVVTREDRRDKVEITAYFPTNVSNAPLDDGQVRLIIASLEDAVTLPYGTAFANDSKSSDFDANH